MHKIQILPDSNRPDVSGFFVGPEGNEEDAQSLPFDQEGERPDRPDLGEFFPGPEGDPADAASLPFDEDASRPDRPGRPSGFFVGEPSEDSFASLPFDSSEGDMSDLDDEDESEPEEPENQPETTDLFRRIKPASEKNLDDELTDLFRGL